MQDKRHIVDAIYMHLFIYFYRSYRYTFHGHLIPLFISTEMWPSCYDNGLVSWIPCRIGGSNPFFPLAIPLPPIYCMTCYVRGTESKVDTPSNDRLRIENYYDDIER